MMTIEEVNKQLKQHPRGVTTKQVANIDALRKGIAEARRQFAVAIAEANKLGQLHIKRRLWSLGLQLGALKAQLNKISR